VKVMRDPFRPIAIDVPPGLETIISRCLAKDPEQRFPKVSALAISLAPFSEKKERLDRVLRVQPLSLPPMTVMKPEDVPPYRPPGAPTQAAVVTDTAIDFDDEDPFKKKRGGWGLFGFGVAGALAGGAILVGVAMYAGKIAETPAPTNATPPASAEPTPLPSVTAASPPTEDPPAPNAAAASTGAAKPSGTGKRALTPGGGTKPAAARASATTTGAAPSKAVDPDKLLETR
jgi:hypothetical protein